jgi:hypothetical protein
MSNLNEVELPVKRLETQDTRLQALQHRILSVVQITTKSPAKIKVPEPVAPKLLAKLVPWAHHFGYVLHYKEKKKRFDDVPDDIRHEGRYAMVYTIEFYWV